jgi:hypothetical protein
MKPTQYTFDASATPLNPSAARKAAMQWANRRNYPIALLECTTNVVRVELEAPTVREHNRAVNSLGRILIRLLNRAAL